MRGVLALVLAVAACGEERPRATPAVGSAGAGSATGSAAPAVSAAAALAPSKGAAERAHPEPIVVECPAVLDDALDDDARLAALLDSANTAIAAASFAAAWTCADRAADLVPTSVEAHHLRGAALVALGRDDEAQLAYALALALDPDDPETLRAVADFYINSKRERGRDALRLGLELAQRGSRRVLARRRRNPPLAADLALLEGQALNDLGRSDEALERIDVALRLAPGRADAMHEKGVALFDLSRFADAKAALAKALAVQPDDAYSHQMLGLALEQLGDPAGAERALARAVELAPTELAAPVAISPAEFAAEVEAVIASLPSERRTRVRSVRLELADVPDPVDLTAVKPPFPPTILGLYRGPVGQGAQAPVPEGETPSIVLYRKNLARAVKTRAELVEQIRETLLHEIGHLEGLDEDDLRRRGME